eukprot:m.278555 g.278555  ORF g.278555 m.278555 type:complete len:66 (-) comp137481_c0_seq1:243-440(-)
MSLRPVDYDCDTTCSINPHRLCSFFTCDVVEMQPAFCHLTNFNILWSVPLSSITCTFTWHVATCS